MAAAHVLAADERLPSALSFSLTRTETLASFESPTSDGGASDDAFDARALSAVQLHETFLGAELFASAVLSRLRREPLALDARLWALQEHENRLWALKQQALLGSCDTSRGSKAYLAALDPTAAAAAAGGAAGAGRLSWRPCCCFRMMGESKMCVLVAVHVSCGGEGDAEAYAASCGRISATCRTSRRRSGTSASCRTFAPSGATRCAPTRLCWCELALHLPAGVRV